MPLGKREVHMHTAALSTPASQPYSADPHTHLANDIVNLYASIQAASYQLLKLIRRFDEAELAQANGFFTTAQWLSYYLGLGPNAAREKVRVARALEGLPLIDAAFSAGKLSYSKVRALTRAAHANNEAALLDAAFHASAYQVERIVRDQLRIQKGTLTVDRQPELSWHEDDNGDVVFKGRLPKALGGLVVKAIERILEDEPAFDPEAADAEPLATRRARALVEIAENSLSPEPKRPQSSADRFIVHIDHDDPALSQSAIERLTCDGSIVVHQADAEGNPLNVGRKTRTIPPALRRALLRRDKGCRFPGCTHTRFVDAHHVQHWAQGGETKLDNLILLCRRHHTLIHDKRASVCTHKPAQGAVQFHFYSADGERLLPTGDGCVANAGISVLPPANVAGVSAETSDQQSPFAPINPTTRVDYDEVAWVLGQWAAPPSGIEETKLE